MARYVLLRIDDDVEADALYTPAEMKPVGAELVADLDPSDAASVASSRYGSGERDDLLSAVTRSYDRAVELATEWEASA